MGARRRRGRAALGFSVHTGWAILVAVSLDPTMTSVAVLDRRRVVMIPSTNRETPRFVYHAARELPPGAAESLVRRAAAMSVAEAKVALQAAVEDLALKEHEVIASSIIIGNQPPAGSLEAILKSHALIHASEGALFREAIRRASEALEISVTEIRAKELQSRAATTLGVSAAKVVQHLIRIGHAAGRPWAKDHRDACLAAWIALAGR
jgi:hypothetical protein